MKRNIFLITILTIITAYPGCKMPAEQSSLRVQSVIGTAILKSARGKVALKPGDILRKGDTVETSEKSIVDLAFSDRGLFRVYENTTVYVAEILSKINKDTGLALEKGRIFASLGKLKKGTVSIKTRTMLASVRGTSFRVSAETKKARLDVLRGSVAVNPVLRGEVIKKIEKTVSEKQAVELNESDVEDIVEGRRDLRIIPLGPKALDELQKDTEEVVDSFFREYESTEKEPGLDREVRDELRGAMDEFMGEEQQDEKVPGEKDNQVPGQDEQNVKKKEKDDTDMPGPGEGLM